MTVLSRKKSFTEKFQEYLDERLNLSNKENLEFIAISPPLVPQKPFDVEVAKKSGYYNFPPTGAMYLCASIDSLNLPNINSQVIDLNNTILKFANEKENFEYSMWQIPLNDLNKKNTQLVF